MKEHLEQLREELITLRNASLQELPMPDFDGAVILSHAIRWLAFKIEGKPYEPTTD